MNNNTTTNIQLLSPFSGISCALAKVPDAAFASKMVGDGYAVDPIESKLYAPCAAKVTHEFAPAKGIAAANASDQPQ